MSQFIANYAKAHIANQISQELTPSAKEQWGLVDANSGANIVEFDSFISCEVNDEKQVVEEAVEEGSFASYNKVDDPIEIKAILAKTGTTADLQDALDTIKSYADSTELVNLVTPTYEYESLNIERYNYELKQEIGRGVLYVEFYLLEIREVGSEYTNVKIPETQNRGSVQTTGNNGYDAKKNSAPNQSMLHAGVGKVDMSRIFH